MSDEFKHRLRQIQFDRGLKNKEIAELSGLPLPTVESYLQKGVKPRFDALVALANALECSTDYLTGLRENYKYAQATEADYRKFAYEFVAADLRIHMSRSSKNGFDGSTVAIAEALAIVRLLSGIPASSSE